MCVKYYLIMYKLVPAALAIVGVIAASAVVFREVEGVVVTIVNLIGTTVVSGTVCCTGVVVGREKNRCVVASIFKTRNNLCGSRYWPML
jgi:hypothetical protein